MKRIGITGGIGSGKSEVTDYLREKGRTVIDADEVAREAAMPGEPAMLQLREEMGDDVFNDDGTLDRQELARIMFSNPIALMTVNEIFHGDIKERIEKHARACEEKGDKEIFLSIPLLFETDAAWMADETWLITADEDVRVRRVLERDGMTEEDVRARMASQMPDEQKREKADFIIENNGTIAELREKLEEFLANPHGITHNNQVHQSTGRVINADKT